MTGAALAVLALVAGVAQDAAPSAPGAADPRPENAAAPTFRVALLAEGGVSAVNVMGAELMAGGRLTGRLGPFALAFSFDLPVALPDADAEPGALVLFGGGLARDLSTRVGWHGALLVGSQRVVLRDFVYGDTREVLEGAIGVRAGVEWRAGDDRPRDPGQLGLVPLVGVSVTLLYVGEGSDPLRDAEWGGFTGLVSLTLGLEASNRRPVAP